MKQKNRLAQHGRIGLLDAESHIIHSDFLEKYANSDYFKSPAVEAIYTNLPNDNWGPYGVVGAEKPLILTSKIQNNAALPPTEGSAINYAPLQPDSMPLQSISVKNPMNTIETPPTGGMMKIKTHQKKLVIPKYKKSIDKSPKTPKSPKIPKTITETSSPKTKIKRVYKKEI